MNGYDDMLDSRMHDLFDPDTIPRYTECAQCGKPGEFFNSPGGSWWGHFGHPTDGHDFEPMKWPAIPAFTPAPAAFGGAE